jgi:homoserine dehydrogenase
MIGGEVIEALAWEHRRAWHDEATVGASSPFLYTLTNLVRTRDRVHLIEGCLSGTPDFLSGQLIKRGAESTARPRLEILRHDIVCHRSSS